MPLITKNRGKNTNLVCEIIILMKLEGNTVWYPTKRCPHGIFAVLKTLSIECVVRGYHVYKDVWNPTIGEQFDL